MSIGIADVLSLGVSAEFPELVSSGSQVTVSIAEGQTGKLGFTTTLSCSSGKGQCDDGEVEGKVCCKLIFPRALKLQSNEVTGPTMSGDDVAGTYRVIIEA
jgi:hypothetical protein